jgi:hypothetical protein
MNNLFVIYNTVGKLMESLNSCPDFFRKGSGERLFLRHELLHQKMMLMTRKSKLFNFYQDQKPVTNLTYQKKAYFDICLQYH